jgi:cytochrome P450 monooxygenase-1
MRRLTTTNVTLSDGIVIPKNSLTFVSAHRNWDAGVYENPHVWDGYRFLKMRQQPGKENTAQFVSVSPDHMGFGYGLHACPGRFFASEEIKIALCHILMEYDLKPVLGSNTEPQRFGLSMTANPTARLAVRRRQEEIPIQLVA